MLMSAGEKPGRAEAPGEILAEFILERQGGIPHGALPKLDA
jgi:hypothetical protein